MSFPEWGYSYNALYVPLTCDWQCSLVPARDVQEVDCDWKLSYEKRQQKRRERTEQIAQDRKDFDRLFRVTIDRRAARTCSEFSAYTAFINEHLRVSSMDAPVDGEGVTRILRDAVRDGWLIPAIDRFWRGSRRVTRLYAPQNWPKRTPDPKPTVYAPRNGRFVPLTEDGRLIDCVPYVPVAARITSTRRTGSADGTDWLDTVETAAGALIVSGDNDAEGSNGGASDADLFNAGSSGTSTPLGNAQPFQFGADNVATFGDAMQTGWLPSKGGPPNQWLENPSGKTQWRLYDGAGNAAVDIDFGHDHGFGSPHSHNWDNGVRDKGNAFSLLPD
ncbi:hypothetical protein [Paraburkholderia caballeronis]|uniref:hypothetical protein n=1 Tax=Paraburkholderia caballeronis TaxID=416943 RepID=UPI0010658B77|nr:hypothetical protein [Paraburkholderia caballeronis]TDV18331.1 hypothetical protein C7408_10387 [Paraburkholderia caballeronis]TDV20131.1 hypothetical protein C7406_103354 [Paraburkholderia caballeronis]TDV28348.1 hypothetical protein C7404_103354 [Paraburkholderia caballeronis]